MIPDGRKGPGFLTGVLAGALGAVAVLGLSPATRRHMRPVLLIALKEAMSVGERLRRTVEQAQEDVSDLVAEAQFERLKGYTNGHAPSEERAE